MSDTTLRTAAADGAAANLEGAWFAVGDGATGADQVSNERLQPTYDPAAASEADLTASLTFTGTPAQVVSHLLVFDAAVAGSFRFARPLTGDLAFNAAGNLSLTEATVVVS